MKTLLTAASLCAGLLSITANAAPVSINITGTVTTATGTLADELGNTITASFLFDLDGNAATYIDLDSSNNPQEDFSAAYTFGSGTYNWSAASSGGGSIGSTYVTVTTWDDYVTPEFNAGQPFDVFDLWGSATTSGVCPQYVIDVKGYCDETDFIPGDGFEMGLVLAMPVNWFGGTNLPGYIPDLNSLLGSALWGNDSQDGILVGEFDGTVTSMTVSSVPVPAAAWLFGSGLLGLIGMARRNAAQA